MKRLTLITSFVLFIALCVSAAYWAMLLFKPPIRAVVAPPEVQVIQPAPKLQAAASLLGGHSAVVSAGNFQLKGVLVASDPLASVAILAANGKPARAFRTSAEILPGVTLGEINRRYVLLSEGGVIKRVELPEDSKTKINSGLISHTASLNTHPAKHNILSNLPDR
jgi:general secretion pathway protein C